MRDKAADEQCIREAIKTSGSKAVVYVTSNHYDGGYEVRIDNRNVFVDYETVDAKNTDWVYEKN